MRVPVPGLVPGIVTVRKDAHTPAGKTTAIAALSNTGPPSHRTSA